MHGSDETKDKKHLKNLQTNDIGFTVSEVLYHSQTDIYNRLCDLSWCTIDFQILDTINFPVKKCLIANVENQYVTDLIFE